MRTRIVLFLLISGLAVAAVCLGFSAKQGRLLYRDEVATAWVGLSEDELYMFRIDLRSPSGGEVAYSFLDDPPTVMTVDSWSYDPQVGSRISYQLRPASGEAIELSGDVIGVRMELVVSQGDWRREVFLRREPDLKSRWERLRGAMKAGSGCKPGPSNCAVCTRSSMMVLR